MFNKITEKFSDLTPNIYLFRIIAIVLLIVILISQFPWTKRLLAKALDFPELRHHIHLNIATNSTQLVSYEEVPLQVLKLLYGSYRVLNPYSCLKVRQTEPLLIEMHCLPQTASQNDLDSATLTVANQGFGLAENVLIHVNVKHGHMLDYQVDSQELYEEQHVDLENGVLNLWLDRFASGANIQIELTGTDFLTNSVTISAVSDKGSSINIDSPSFSGQVDTYTTTFTGLFSEAGKFIWEAPSLRKARRWLSASPIFAEALQVLESREFQTVSLATFITIFLIAIFLPRIYIIFIPLIISFIVWLFFDFAIPAWCTLAPLTIILAFLIPRLFLVDKNLRRGSKEYRVTTVDVPVGILVIGGIIIWWFWQSTISFKWILSIVTLLVTYAITVAILMASEEE